jgi:hypothetical protein
MVVVVKLAIAWCVGFAVRFCTGAEPPTAPSRTKSLDKTVIVLSILITFRQKCTHRKCRVSGPSQYSVRNITFAGNRFSAYWPGRRATR